MSKPESTTSRREALLRQLQGAAGEPLPVGVLMEKAQIHPGERTEVKRVLRDLIRDGKVARDGKRYSLTGAEGRSAQQPGQRSGERSEQRGDQQPRQRGGQRSEQKSGQKPEQRSGKRSEQRGDQQPEQRSGRRSEQRGGQQPEQRGSQQPEQRSGQRTEQRSGRRSEHRGDQQPEQRSGQRSEQRGGQRPEQKSGQRSEQRGSQRPEQKSGQRSEQRGGQRPEQKSGQPPEQRSGQQLEQQRSAPRGPMPAAPRSQPRAGRGILGTLTRHRDGFGFVARADRQGDDIFVPPGEASKALDGDLVRVDIVPGMRGRTAGRILEVVERRRRLLIGTYFPRGRSSFVVPGDAGVDGVVPVPETEIAEEGDVVKVALAPGTEELRGEVMERVGKPGEPRVEVLKVAYAKGFSDLFPEEVLEEAKTVPDQVRPEDRKGRADLRRMRLVTIDGEDARDFDDAVYVERCSLPGGGRGFRLVVAIADVAHYVRPGNPLDMEAVRRGTSVYFPMQVLPMLPERLSNGICSLNPDVDRLCMVADMQMDSEGQVQSAEVYEGVMRSAARCTYTEVAQVLEGEKVPEREFLRADFELMAELQERLSGMRRRRGAIDFDLPEAKIVLGPDGQITGIEKRARNRAHRIVEEFMLAANEAVARWFGERSLPTIYRIHDVPDEEKLEAFRALAETQGFEVPEGALGPRALNGLLEKFQDHPQRRALNQLLLRAMMQALYSPENIGHYGLAAEHYLHFTSPIRRYPDLMVHRLLKQAWATQKRETPATKLLDRDLEEVATVSSERERAAMQAEREVDSFYAALFMQDKEGERFPGVVSSVVDFGLFIELERWMVEGLVRIEDLGDGFSLDTVGHALVQRASGRAFRVGDEVEVEVVSASPARRQITLGLVEAGQVRRSTESFPGERRKGRPARPERGAKGRKEQPQRRPKPGNKKHGAKSKDRRGRRGR